MEKKQQNSVPAADEILIEGPRRSLVKAITWRLIATTTTMSIVAVFTGELLLSAGVGIVESISKMFLYYIHERAWNLSRFGKIVDHSKSRFVTPHQSRISEGERMSATGTLPLTFWFTGLPGSGKTTLSYALERRLFDEGFRSTVLDGENMRLGLCRDLGFEHGERSENVRRTAETAKILNKAGVIAICALISPYREDRRRARGIIGDDRFVEVHLDASEEIRHERSSRYGEAEKGMIKSFSGVSDRYDPPENPDIRLATGDMGIEECVDILVAELQKRLAESEVVGDERRV